MELLTKYGIAKPRGGAYCPPGWLPLAEELIQKLITLGWDKDCVQIKEKFGGLRFYIGAGTDEVHNACHEAEVRSFAICQDCGAPGTMHNKRWMATLCPDCILNGQC